VAVTHTLAGPDHYLPFLTLSASRSWTRRRPLGFTALCGLLHCLASVLLAFLLSWTIGGSGILEGVDLWRGRIAGAVLVGTGVAALLLLARRRGRTRRHRHAHGHVDGRTHDHEHAHVGEHCHAHPQAGGPLALSLALVFVVGPCEILVPLSLGAFGRHGVAGLLIVGSTFAFATALTMVLSVLVIQRGLAIVRAKAILGPLSWVPGAVLIACGLALLTGL
jgi:ABC-type nickel/cobalt efflux system permease component RcnA